MAAKLLASSEYTSSSTMIHGATIRPASHHRKAMDVITRRASHAQAGRRVSALGSIGGSGTGGIGGTAGPGPIGGRGAGSGIAGSSGGVGNGGVGPGDGGAGSVGGRVAVMTRDLPGRVVRHTRRPARVCADYDSRTTPDAAMAETISGATKPLRLNAVATARRTCSL